MFPGRMYALLMLASMSTSSAYAAVAGPLPYDYLKVQTYRAQMADKGKSTAMLIDAENMTQKSNGDFHIPGTGCQFSLYRMTAYHYTGVSQCNGIIYDRVDHTLSSAQHEMTFTLKTAAQTWSKVKVVLPDDVLKTSYVLDIPEGATIDGVAMGHLHQEGVWTPHKITLNIPGLGMPVSFAVAPKDNSLMVKEGKWTNVIYDSTKSGNSIRYVLPGNITFSIY